LERLSCVGAIRSPPTLREGVEVDVHLLTGPAGLLGPAAGDRAAALRQVLMGENALSRELGIKASPALREAADAAVGSPVGPPLQWARRRGQPARCGPRGDCSRRRRGWCGLSAPGLRGGGRVR
jgi:hypothetical protein